MVIIQDETNWIALYSKPRHENKVAFQLQQNGIESYVPLHRVVRKWSDRRKIVDMPLIPSYVFAHLHPKEYNRVFVANGIVRIIKFSNRIAIVRPNEIELLRRATQHERTVIISSNCYRENDEVEIVDGIFTGYHGKVVRANKLYTIAILIEELESSIVVEILKSDVRLLVH